MEPKQKQWLYVGRVSGNFLKGYGKKTAKCLARDNIKSIVHLKKYLTENIGNIKEKGLSLAKILNSKVTGTCYIEWIPCFNLVNHMLALNPYQSLYRNEWRKNTVKNKHTSKYKSVTDPVEHIYNK